MASKEKVVAVFSLLNAAAVWGLLWYPYRVLAQQGISGEIATLATYLIALAFGLLVAGPVWREWRAAGWWGVALTLAAGWTNLGYVLAMLGGEVMRVLLLFYLAPLWTVLLARMLLGERLTGHGYAIIALSLGGAFAMLWQPTAGWPLPQNRAEWIGLTAGMAFAVTNVLVRRTQHLSINFKSVSVWFGTSLLTALALLLQGGVEQPTLPLDAWWLMIAVGLVLCATSIAVQYGLTNLPANQAIILFMFELVVAALSAYFLAGEAMGRGEIVGALLIAAASLFSGRLQQSAEAAQTSQSLVRE